MRNIQIEIEKYGVDAKTFYEIAAKYALHQIKDIKNPSEASKKFIEIVKEFTKI